VRLRRWCTPVATPQEKPVRLEPRLERRPAALWTAFILLAAMLVVPMVATRAPVHAAGTLLSQA
jgi:hypothetical protein